VVEYVAAVELRVVIIAVLAVAASANLVAHHLLKRVVIAVSHWLVCMCDI
jgi:hypothetical protein